MSIEMISAKEAALKWNTSLRRVQDFCNHGRVSGAVRFGKSWMIPADAPRPVDGRSKDARASKDAMLPMPRRSPNLCLTNLYNTPGSAEKVSKSLSSNPEAKALFDAGIAYSRGEIDQVYEYAQNFLQRRTGFYAVAGSGKLLAFCAIWRGDLVLWKEAKRHMAKAPCHNAADRDILALVMTAASSSVFSYTDYPEWFIRGNFELLHPDAHPGAKVYYAKYLYMVAYAVAIKQLDVPGVQGLTLMRMLPNALEPMISQAVVDKTVIPEIHLRLWCATAYHNVGQDDLAIPHIDRAISLALPDRLYGILAEHWKPLDNLLDERLALADPSAQKTSRGLHKSFFTGQAKLGSILHNRNIAINLSPREREIAKLVAFGFTNKHIAKTLSIGDSTVKSVVQSIMQKTGLTSRTDFALIL